MMRRATTLTYIAALLLVLALGCGGDDSTDSPSVPEDDTSSAGDQGAPGGNGSDQSSTGEGQQMGALMGGAGMGGAGMGGAGMGGAGMAGDAPPAEDPLAGEPEGEPLAGPVDMSAPSRLSEAAIAELAELDAGGFFGEAVVTGEEQMGNATKVTFDRRSGPICLWGDEFSAFYSDRGSDKTMLLLDGGGACWSALCAASAKVEGGIISIGPASMAEGNPFADWNLVFVPYCDGSVFSGENETVHPDGRMRYHHGRQNLAAGLDLMRAHFPETTQVLVGGFSAGGYGTLPGMISTRIAFPQADLFVMNDSGPGVQNPDNAEATAMRIEEWDYAKFIPPSCTACEGGQGQSTNMFTWMLDNDPTVKISVLSYLGDRVIGMVFNGLDSAAYEELLLTETGKVQEAHPDRFKRYMLPGNQHVVSAMWGKVTANGVEVSDWVNAMVSSDDSVWTDLIATGP